MVITMNLTTIVLSLSCPFFRKCQKGLLLITLFFTYCQIRDYLHEKLTDAMLNAIDEKKLLVLLDMSKAFDTINHGILLYKPLYIGVSPLSVAWFASYL